MAFKGSVDSVSFDVKAKLEEKERKSQASLIGFSLFLSTKPSVVKFQVDGTATLSGKDADIQKMLEVDPETKIPTIFQRIYQSAFTAMYLMSSVLNAPPPPNDLLHSGKQAGPREGVSVEMGTESTADDGVTVEVAAMAEEKAESVVAQK
jgi:hypothetical protein